MWASSSAWDVEWDYYRSAHLQFDDLQVVPADPVAGLVAVDGLHVTIPHVCPSALAEDALTQLHKWKQGCMQYARTGAVRSPNGRPCNSAY